MAKQTWEKFTDKHPTAPAFTAVVSASLPKVAPILDRTGKKVPTPYKLLTEWLKAHLSGDWTSIYKRTLVIVKVSDAADVAIITKKFPIIGVPGASPASSMTTQINYSDSDYGSLAKSLGYLF